MSGKGDRPRNCFSRQFRANYDSIDWRKPEVAFVMQRGGSTDGATKFIDMRQTYTYAVLDVSPATFREIHAKLKAAGYGHAIMEEDGKALIDMHGIALGCPGQPLSTFEGPFNITVNGKKHAVRETTLDYRGVALLDDKDPERIYSCMWRSRLTGQSGILCPVDKPVELVEGMSFDICHTGNA
jgi:hypothetical protein